MLPLLALCSSQLNNVIPVEFFLNLSLWRQVLLTVESTAPDWGYVSRKEGQILRQPLRLFSFHMSQVFPFYSIGIFTPNGGLH